MWLQFFGLGRRSVCDILLLSCSSDSARYSIQREPRIQITFSNFSLMFYGVDSRSVNSVAQVCSLVPSATQQLFIPLFTVNSKRYISHDGVCGCQNCNFSFNIRGGGDSAVL